MATQYEKIHALVENEINWLLDNPNEVEHTINFFASGGFHNWLDDDIHVAYTDLKGNE